MEVERQACKIEIRQVFDSRVLIEIIGVMQHGHREIGGVPERARDFEPGWCRRMYAGGGGETVEATEVHRAIRL